MNEFKIKSKEEMEKEVENDLKKALLKAKKEFKKEQKEKKKAEKEEKIKLDTIISQERLEFEVEKARVKALNYEDFAEWLIEKHQDYTITLQYMLGGVDWLNEPGDEERTWVLTYIFEMFNLLASYEIDFLSNEIRDILYERNEAELLSILNVLNYIN
jgi:23S rRNA pseudoU1915 N3-methylase RlmH